MKIIYLYTTPTYQAKNWYKIGETTSNPEKRVQSQDNASNPERLKLMASWQTADWVTDKLVHKKLVELGFAKLRGNREWFELSEMPEDDIESALIEIKADPKEREKSCVVINIPILDYSEIWWGKGTNP